MTCTQGRQAGKCIYIPDTERAPPWRGKVRHVYGLGNNTPARINHVTLGKCPSQFQPTEIYSTCAYILFAPRNIHQTN